MFQDKLGVYRVGDLKFYSKLEAIEAMQRTGIHLHWDFNETVFDCYDWTVEPTETVLELYRQRAQQLRDKYDYIVLFWSGGADSDTVMHSFIDNDIKLDEIVSYGNYEASSDKTDFMNSEMFYRTLPQVQYLKDTHPWMTFRIVDLSQDTVDTFNTMSQTDWIYNANMMLTPNCVARDRIGYKVKAWADLITQGKKLCVLWGADKPRVVYENNKFAVKFVDMIDNCVTVSSIANKNDYADELFFWSPDAPKIVIKQAHLVKRYMDNNLFDSPYISFKESGIAFKEHNGKKYWLNNHGLHQIIYPNWNIHTFDAGKTPSIIVSPRDRWFFELEDGNVAKYVWKIGVEKVFSTIPDYWKNDPTDMSRGIKASWSKTYFIE